MALSLLVAMSLAEGNSGMVDLHVPRRLTKTTLALS